MVESEQQPVPVTRKPLRQPPSVPFVWEERPGLPRPDWKPVPTTPADVPAPPPVPVKLVASVPFEWEETPGKPLPCFADDPSRPPPLELEPLFLPPPPMYANRHISYGSDDISSDAITSGIPVDEFDILNSEAMSSQTSPAYESDGSTGSYMTGASSLVGASFLEKLFPHLSPEVEAEDVPVSCDSAQVKPVASDTDSGFPVRKTPTLGELILTSRRRSYMSRRKNTIEIRKLQNPPMEFTKNVAGGCCLLAPGIKIIQGVEWKTFQARLKLI